MREDRGSAAGDDGAAADARGVTAIGYTRGGVAISVTEPARNRAVPLARAVA